LIAAVSIVKRSTLATRNIADIRTIPELELLNPWDFR
jgi:predicted nucleic acid-binding protein